MELLWVGAHQRSAMASSGSSRSLWSYVASGTVVVAVPPHWMSLSQRLSDRLDGDRQRAEAGFPSG